MSLDGGSTWETGYASDRSFELVAIALFSDRSFEAVPEPSSWLMMLIGFGSIGFLARRSGATMRRTLPSAAL